jgi:hypothetical protein
MLRYRLRTLLIVLAVAPPALAALWFAGPPVWFTVVLCIFTLPALYLWVVDEEPTAVGLVVRWVLVMIALLAIVGSLMPAVQ